MESVIRHFVPVLLVLSLLFSVAVPAAAAESQAAVQFEQGSSSSDIAQAIEALKVRLTENGEKLTVQMTVKFLCGFNRGLCDVFSAQFMTPSQIEDATEKVVNSSVTFLAYDDMVKKEIITTMVPIDTNYKELLNVHVLRKVCHVFYDRQFFVIPEGRTDLDITPYEHYVGELIMHVLAYRLIDIFGGYDSIFPDIYTKVLIADLNITEPRYTMAIKFFSKLLA